MQAVPYGVEPPLAETDHLCRSTLHMKPHLVYKSLVTPGYTDMIRTEAGEIQDGVMRAMWEGILRTAWEGYCERI